MHTVKADIGATSSRFHARDRAQLVIAVYEDGIAEGSAPDAGCRRLAYGRVDSMKSVMASRLCAQNRVSPSA
jgi:hypothetical protein